MNSHRVGILAGAFVLAGAVLVLRYRFPEFEVGAYVCVAFASVMLALISLAARDIIAAAETAIRASLSLRKREGDPLCPACGYNLMGNISGVCPECGRPVPPDAT